MTFDEWVKLGYDLGFSGPPVCFLHDGVPQTAFEDSEQEESLEPCIFVMRLYDSLLIKKEVEANHAPSLWRAVELGWDE